MLLWLRLALLQPPVLGREGRKRFLLFLEAQLMLETPLWAQCDHGLPRLDGMEGRGTHIHLLDPPPNTSLLLGSSLPRLPKILEVEEQGA